MKDNPSELIAQKKEGGEAETEGETENIISIPILRLMTVNDNIAVDNDNVTATTPLETGITKPTSRKRSAEQYSKRIWLMHMKRSYIGNETCL